MNFPHRARYALFTAALAIPSIFFTPAAVNAANSGTTTLTLNVDGNHGGSGNTGSLSISAPTSLNLGSSIKFPASFAVPLGLPITVTDTRTNSLGWSSSVVLSDLTPTVGTTPAIPATVFAYNPGTITYPAGSTVTGFIASNVSNLVNVVSTLSVRATASWIPTIDVNVAYAPVDGAYTGTMTSSVF